MAAPSQVRVQLHTNEASLELPEKTGPLLVSTNLNRHAFSQLINQLLETPSDRPIPLEVIVNGSFLRTDLASFLTSNSISSEGVLGVEYTRALLPPTYRTCFQHDDWVGAVDVLSSTSIAGSGPQRAGSPRILSGSFDGLLRVWDNTGHTTATSALCTSAPCQSIYSAKWLSADRVVSSGYGVPVRLWSYTESSNSTPSANGIIEPQLDLYGHRGSSNSLVINSSIQQMLSAGSDGQLSLFSSSVSLDDQPQAPDYATRAPASKRRRLSSSHKNSQNATPKAGALTTLDPSHTTTSSTSSTANTKPLTGTIFHPHHQTIAYTTSRDRTLRTIDLTTARTISTLTPQPNISLTCLTSLSTLNLLAAGTAGASISLIDPRTSSDGSATGARRTEVSRCMGFKNEIRSLSTSPVSEYQYCAASFDGTVRIFDVRDARSALSGDGGQEDVGGVRRIKPLYKIAHRSNGKSERVVGGEGVKLFDVVWDKEVGVVSCGEDGAGGGGMVQINRAGSE